MTQIQIWKEGKYFCAYNIEEEMPQIERMGDLFEMRATMMKGTEILTAQPPHPSGLKSDEELLKLAYLIWKLIPLSGNEGEQECLNILRALEQSGVEVGQKSCISFETSVAHAEQKERAYSEGYKRGHAKGVMEGEIRALDSGIKHCEISWLDRNKIKQFLVSLRDQKLKELSQ